MSTLFLFAVGLVLLTAGAELLVRGASALAVAARISPLVIGLTIVAYGTSAPELVVSIQASLRGQQNLAVGNVVGSNIFNVLFILGLSALIIPLRVAQRLIRLDVPLMIVLSLLVAAMAADGRIGMGDGLLLTGGLVTYTIWGILHSRREQAEVEAQYAAELGNLRTKRSVGGVLTSLALIATGLLLLVLGARWLTDSAVVIARYLGVSELVIGLTVVAAGTSLPEVATSVVAAIRGERDIAVGNVVGSNLFNLMGVLGICGLFSGSGIAVSQTALQFDIPMMIAVAVACLPVFFTGHRIARWEGALFLGYFCAYTAYLFLEVASPAISRTFSVVMLGFVLPLTTVTLAVTAIRALRAPRDVADS